jgi:hypothetical protein
MTSSRRRRPLSAFPATPSVTLCRTSGRERLGLSRLPARLAPAFPQKAWRYTESLPSQRVTPLQPAGGQFQQSSWRNGAEQPVILVNSHRDWAYDMPEANTYFLHQTALFPCRARLPMMPCPRLAPVQVWVRSHFAPPCSWAFLLASLRSFEGPASRRVHPALAEGPLLGLGRGHASGAFSSLVISCILVETLSLVTATPTGTWPGGSSPGF